MRALFFLAAVAMAQQQPPQTPPAAPVNPPSQQTSAPATPASQQTTTPAPVAAPAAPATPTSQQTAPAAAESPVPPTASWITGSIDFGYRWAGDVGGSYPEYRTVVNLGAGPRLFGLDLSIVDPKKRLFDRVNVRAYNWGDPYNSAHIDASKLGIYDFSFDYRSIVYFNAVPSYANPAAPAGIDEQSFDVLRRTASFDLTLLPGKHIVPYFGFFRNTGHGNGIQTWVQDANDEFAVPIYYHDGTNNYRGGVRFEYTRFHVTLEEGGTTFQDDDQSSFTGANPGDRTTPLLGQSLSLTGLQQAYGIRATGTYSQVLATAQPASWLDLYGQFLYSDPKTNVSYSDLALGNFALLSSLLFYSGEQTTAAGVASQPHTSANAGFELRPTRRLRVIESWMTDRYHDAASPLVAEQLFLAAPSTPQNVLTSLNYSQVVNYNQQEIDAFFDLTPHMTLRGGYRYVWGDATVLAGDLSQTGPLAFGKLGRNTALAGFSFRPSEKFSLNLDYEGASSDQIYFRTSMNDYSRASARARFQPLPSLTFAANFQVLDNQNPDPSIRYDFLARDNSLSVNWIPPAAKWITLTGEYDRSTMRSDISFLLPPFYSPAVSAYRDNAHTATSTVELAPPPRHGVAPKITFGGSLFISSGSRPSQYYQPMAMLSIPLLKHLSWNAEWLWYGFGEQFYLYEGFRDHMLQISLKLFR